MSAVKPESNTSKSSVPVLDEKTAVPLGSKSVSAVVSP